MGQVLTVHLGSPGFAEAMRVLRRRPDPDRIDGVRAFGAWESLPGVPHRDEVLGPDDPVAVTTLAYTRPSQFPRFARTSMPAEQASGESPDASITIGIVRPPRFVASFSLWHSVVGMTSFAHPTGGGPHSAAVAESRRKAFHHEQAFVRGRPYGEQGHWACRRG